MSHESTSNADLDRLDLDEIKRFAARRWKLIVATAVTCAVLALGVCVSVTPSYTATSQVLLDPRKQHIFGQDQVSPDAALDSSIVDSQIPIILSTRLLAKVVIKDRLADDPEFAAKAKAGMLDRIFGVFRPVRQKAAEVPSLDGIDPQLAPVVLHLFNKIDVTRVAKSYVLSLSVSSRDPGKAMRLANSLAQTYVEDQVDVHAKSVQQAATFFETRLGNLRDQVRGSERAVADYRTAHGLTTTNIDGKITIGEQQLQSLNERLATLTSDTAEKLARYQQAKQFQGSGINLDTLPEIIRSPVITQLRTQQADLMRRASDLSAMYGPAYPAITQIRAQQIGLSKAMASEMKRLVLTTRNDYDVAKVREEALRKTIGGLTEYAGGDNEVGVKLRELERTNMANKALFENFLNRAKLAQEQSSFEEPDARLISPALEPTSPSSPKTKLIVPVAGLAGLLVGLGLAALADLRRRRAAVIVAPRADAFILSRVPEAASINASGGAPDAADCVRHMESQPNSAFARSIDQLAAKLSAPAQDGKGRAVALVPLSAGQGATSLAVCLAAAAGRNGRRVLLIDADQARRGLSKRIGAAGKPGLGDVLAGDLSATRAVVPQTLFAALPAGQKPIDAIATAKRLRGFLGEACSRFDLVVVDGPALAGSPEAPGIIEAVNGFALVACWDELVRDDFVAAIDAAADKPSFLGIVLNRVARLEPAEMAMAS